MFKVSQLTRRATMRVCAAFSRLLRLGGVWIRDVQFTEDRVVVWLVLRRRRLICPLCGYSTRHRHNRQQVESVWRHLDLGVWRLELDPNRLENLFEIGVDEVSWRKQHRYLTLVADHIRGQIVWGHEGRDAKTADRFFKEIGKSRSRAIEVISLDMGPGYAKSAREHAPQAILAIDPYHVVALGNRALDDVRRDYWNELRRAGDKTAARRFKDARWSLLKRPRT
jgi:transposase